MKKGIREGNRKEMKIRIMVMTMVVGRKYRGT